MKKLAETPPASPMPATLHLVTSLAGRLTKEEDRESYAALVSYSDSLPPGDEFRRLMEMLGLVSLLGQGLPDALAEAMTELRELTATAGDYHAKVDERLGNLPAEIAQGVDIPRITKDIAEAFRQQIAITGLETTAMHLRSSSGEITKLSGQISTTLKPLATTISAEVAKLTAAAAELQRQNAQLESERRSGSVAAQVFLVIVVFVLGATAEMVWTWAKGGN